MESPSDFPVRETSTYFPELDVADSPRQIPKADLWPDTRLAHLGLRKDLLHNRLPLNRIVPG